MCVCESTCVNTHPYIQLYFITDVQKHADKKTYSLAQSSHWPAALGPALSLRPMQEG